GCVLRPSARSSCTRRPSCPDRDNSSTSRSRFHLPLQIVVLEVLERKLDIPDQRCRDLSHIQEGFVGRLERPEPLQYFISHLKYRTRFARHFETSSFSSSNFACQTQKEWISTRVWKPRSPLLLMHL